jgi:hypothetical protein
MPTFKTIDKLNPPSLTDAPGAMGSEVNVADYDDITVQFTGDFGGAVFDVVGRVTDSGTYVKLFQCPGPGQYRVPISTMYISTQLVTTGNPPNPGDITGWVGGRSAS